MSPSVCECAWEALRGDPMKWLLDESKPNLHWRVLVELVGRPVDSLIVRRTRGGASAARPVATLLADLLPDGTWATTVPDWRRYDGPGWRFVAAEALGADPADPRLEAAGRRFLEETSGEGGFAPREGSQPSPIVTARLVRALTGLGFGGQLRVQEALAWFEEEPASWPDRPADAGVAAALLPVIPAAGRRRLALERRVVDRVRAALETERPSLSALGFPNLGRTDLGEMLWGLARCGVRYDRWIGEPLARLQALQGEGGRWPVSHPTPVSLVKSVQQRAGPGAPSRWITLGAVVAMYAYAVEAGLPRLFPQKPVGSE